MDTVKEISIFNPVLYSSQENQFLLEHLGEPPITALRSLPQGVNTRAVQPILARVFELCEAERRIGEKWVGLEALKESIRVYQREATQWENDRRRNRPRFPSMHSFDSRNRPFRGGPGSDSGEVRTYLGPKGARVPFAIELNPLPTEEWTPNWVEADSPKNGLTIDSEKNRIECGACNHTETFKPDSRASFNAARARMSRHLRKVDTEVEAHREIYTAEFGSVTQ